MSGTESQTLEMGPFGSKDKYKFPRICRYFDCESYDTCLTTAANHNWKVFTCEGCVLAKHLEVVSIRGEED
jgi:hypothetical protein